MSLRRSEKTEIRRDRYKVSVDAEERRRRREDYLVEIRKNKRQETLTKKRCDGHENLTNPSLPIPSDDPCENLLSLNMVAGVFSNDPSLQLESTTHFRKILSWIFLQIQVRVVPRFVEFLKKKDNPKLQFEAVWALTNIACGTSENTKVVIDHGVVPIFIQLLASPDVGVHEQAIWGLGIVAGDSLQYRDFVLSCEALTPLLNQLNENAPISILRNGTWTLSNFFRFKPLPSFEVVKPAILALKRLVHSKDENVVADACRAFVNLSDGSNENIQSVIEAGIVPRLLEIVEHPYFSVYVLVPALRTIRNIISGNYEQTQVLCDQLWCFSHSLIYKLLTKNYMKIIKKEACWTISNIIAGCGKQIQSVIDANLIPTLVNLAQNAAFDIKKEAAWAISNAAMGGSHDQIKYLVEQNCIKPLCDILVCRDLKIILVSLDGLESILKAGDAENNNTGEVNCYTQLIEDVEGLEKIEKLQSHDNNEISQKAIKILETYWLEEEDEGGLMEMVQPQGDDGSHPESSLTLVE